MIREEKRDRSLGAKSIRELEYNKNLYSKQIKCEYISPSQKKCNCIANKNSKYCHHHITKEEKLKLLNSIPLQSNSTKENNQDEDFNFEINLLKRYLRSLVNSNPKKINSSDLRIQLQLIEQIRKLVHSLSIIQSQSKIQNLVMKIINSILTQVVSLINKHSNDENLKNILGNELIGIGNSLENGSSDLNSLLKQLQPKTRNRIFN